MQKHFHKLEAKTKLSKNEATRNLKENFKLERKKDVKNRKIIFENV